jgi:hypothetical protein
MLKFDIDINTRPQLKEKMKQLKKNFIVLWKRYVMQFPIKTWKMYQVISMLKLEESPLYIQHVDGTAFATKQMMLENEW